MSYIDARLPRKLSAGLRIGPEYNTRVVPFANGREQRNRQWLYPKWRASGNMAAFTEDDRKAFRDMFVACGGKWAAFRVFDPLDYFANNEPLAPAVGTSTPVQLVKTYTFPGSATSATVLIQAPIAGTVTIYKDGVAVAGTLDDTKGLFTPDAPWAAGVYTWTGQHERWMRFDSDWGAVTANALHVYTTDIELVEVRR